MNNTTPTNYHPVQPIPEDFTCGICQDEEAKDTELVVAHPGQGIKHPFHAGCLNKWFEIKNTCPTCQLDHSAIQVIHPLDRNHLGASNFLYLSYAGLTKLWGDGPKFSFTNTSENPGLAVRPQPRDLPEELLERGNTCIATCVAIICFIELEIGMKPDSCNSLTSTSLATNVFFKSFFLLHSSSTLLVKLLSTYVFYEPTVLNEANEAYDLGKVIRKYIPYGVALTLLNSPVGKAYLRSACHTDANNS